MSCEKSDIDDNIKGKWRLVKSYSLMGGFYLPETKDQRFELYNDNHKITFDYLGNETSSCNYRFDDTIITIYGENLNGTKWENSYKYWVKSDTLKIRYDGGFEYYDEYFIRTK
jgi:hypothetical protein